MAHRIACLADRLQAVSACTAPSNRTSTKFALLGTARSRDCPSLDRLDETRAFDPIGFTRTCQEGMVAQRGLRRPLPAGGHVERPANAVEHVDQPRRTRRPADPLARKPENLRECPRHQHVLGARGEFEAPIGLFGLEIFGIGMVEHQQHIAGQAGVQPRDLVRGR